MLVVILFDCIEILIIVSLLDFYIVLFLIVKNMMYIAGKVMGFGWFLVVLLWLGAICYNLFVLKVKKLCCEGKRKIIFFFDFFIIDIIILFVFWSDFLSERKKLLKEK